VPQPYRNAVINQWFSRKRGKVGPAASSTVRGPCGAAVDPIVSPSRERSSARRCRLTSPRLTPPHRTPRLDQAVSSITVLSNIATNFVICPLYGVRDDVALTS
jgi:hypothetical protein